MVGRTLSHYKILSEISRGGMGIIYRALDVKLDRVVALKVLPTELVADPERKRRFVQEAKAAAKLEQRKIGVLYPTDSENLLLSARRMSSSSVSKARLPFHGRLWRVGAPQRAT